MFVIPNYATIDMQKISLIQTTEKTKAFWCHAVTSGTNLRRLPRVLEYGYETAMLKSYIKRKTSSEKI